MKRTTLTAALIGLMAIMAGILTMPPVAPAAASPPTGAIIGLTASNESFSANAPVLVDGTVGANPASAWANSGNPWSNASFPMSAVVDLGGRYDVTGIAYYGGQIPFPATAALAIEVSVDGVGYTRVATSTSPAYDAWSPTLPVNAEARFVRFRFDSYPTRFDIAEVAVIGTPTGTPTGSTLITALSAVNGANSANAHRLTDGAVGPTNARAWTNPRPRRPTSFPMTAIIDLGGSYNVTDLHYHVGNIVRRNSDRIVWEYSPTATGPFNPLYTGTGHQWNRWREVAVGPVTAQRLQVTFTSRVTMFNLSEVRVFGSSNEPGGGGGGGGGGTGDCGAANDPADAFCASVNVIDSFGDAPLPAGAGTGPVWGTVTSYYAAYGNRPGMCSIEVHNSYWTAVRHADGALRYYPSWHPPVHDRGGRDECRFTHDHGLDPRTSDLYDEDNPSNVGAPFGFVHSGGAPSGRVEDHPGHKVIVANDVKLTTNNPYDQIGATLNLFTSGGRVVTCDWYSKLHQGTHSADALGFNLHEYYLNYSCDDGTEARIKEMTDFGFRTPGQSATPGFPLTGGPGTVESTCGWFATNAPGPATDPDPSPDSDFGDAKRAFSCQLMNDGQIEELWKPSAFLAGPDGPTLAYDPYYVVMNPSRFALYEWWNYLDRDGDHVGEHASISLVDLCVDGTELRNELSRPGAPGNFVKNNTTLTGAFRVHTYCDSIDATVAARWERDIVAAGGDNATLMAQRSESADNPFRGTRRGVHTKGPVIARSGPANFGSLALFCTDHLGNNPMWPRNPNTGAAVTGSAPWSPGDPDPVCNHGMPQLLSTSANNHWPVEGSTAGATWTGSSYRSNGPAGEIVIDIDALYPDNGVRAPN